MTLLQIVNNENMNKYVVDHSFLIIFISMILIGLALWGRVISKKHPELRLGEIVHLMLLRDMVTIFMSFLVLINLCEAGMAASISVVGQMEVNPFIRVLTHSSLQFLSIVFSILSIVFFMRSLKYKERRWLGLVLSFCCFGVSIIFPYMNLMFIAQGLHQVELLNWFLQGIVNSHATMAEFYANTVYQGYQLDESFSPFQEMQYVMATSTGLTGAHYVVILIEALYMIYIPPSEVSDELLKRFGLDVKVKAGKEGEKPESSDIVKHGIHYIMKFMYGDKGPVNIADLTTKFDSLHTGLRDPARSNLSIHLSAILEDIKLFNKEQRPKLKGEELTTALAAKRKKVQEFWQKSTANGEGFGVKLEDPK